jgi:putative transposase
VAGRRRKAPSQFQKLIDQKKLELEQAHHRAEQPVIVEAAAPARGGPEDLNLYQQHEAKRQMRIAPLAELFDEITSAGSGFAHTEIDANWDGTVITSGDRFFSQRARAASRIERKAMINAEHELSLTRQAELLDLSRASLYYTPVEVSEADLRLMKRIDELHLELPFAGSRMLRDLLNAEGIDVGRKHVATLMRKMGIAAIYRRANTRRRHPAHPVFPYLLRGLLIDRPNQVWAADVTYIPMERGFVYLVAVIDWFSRKVLSWRVSNSLTADFCVEALEEAIDRFGAPEIFNTDQGSQFTAADFLDVLKRHEIRISMDGRGAWRDNVFVERLWRSVKYEEVYLHAYESVSAAKTGIGKYFVFFNARRPHSSLDRRTPDTVYFKNLPLAAAA